MILRLTTLACAILGLASAYLCRLQQRAPGALAAPSTSHREAPTAPDPAAVAQKNADAEAAAAAAAVVEKVLPGAPLLPRPTLAEVLAEARARAAAGRYPEIGQLVRWLPEATAQELAALAAALGYQGSGGPAWRALVNRWVELDPAAALAEAQRLTDAALAGWSGGSGVHYVTPLWALYQSLGRVDPELALQLLAVETPVRIKNVAHLISGIVGADRARAWALTLPGRPELAFLRQDNSSNRPPALDLSDPAAAAARLTPETMRYQLDDVAKAWAAKDPAAATAWARGLGEHSIQALAHAATGLLEADPAKARELLDTLPRGATRMRAEAAYAAKLAATDPAAAASWAAANLHGTARAAVIGSVAAVLAKTDATAALKLLREHGAGDLGDAGLGACSIKGPGKGSSGSGVLGRGPEDVMRAAMATDPAGVMDLLAATGGIRALHDYEVNSGFKTGNGDFARGLFKQWAEKDAPAAARWLGAQQLRPGLDALVKQAASKWAEAGLDALQAFTAGLPAGGTRDLFAEHTVLAAARKDPAGALAWAVQTGSAAAIGAAFQRLALADTGAAVAQFPALPAVVQASQAQGIADRLAVGSPTAAAEFCQSLPPAVLEGLKVNKIIGVWAAQDPLAASQWVAQLPAAPAKDSAISGLVDFLIGSTADRDFPAAATWAAASPDAAAMDRRIKRVAEAWFKADPAGAREEINASALAPAIKQALLSHEK